ncbi:MAG: hypothetical protein KIT58_01440 [Planctomycetota bacterium]|nr:hypothetical protein [Planctomycetota bacterium]
MKFAFGAAVAAGLTLGLTGPGRALDSTSDCCPGGGLVFQVEDTDAEAIRELEERLNEVLVVEESGRIVLREEFKSGLPFPPDRVQMMLGSFVELGPDGKIKVRNPDTVKPYLPMIQRFLDPQGMERLRELQKLPPDEQREAMRRLMGEETGRSRGAPSRARGAQRSRRAAAPAHWSARRAPAEAGTRAREGARRPERRPRHAGASDRELEGAVARLEHRLERLERALREGEGRHAQQPQQRRGLFDLFGRGRDDRRSTASPLTELGRRADTWQKGMRKLAEILEPDDFQRIGRTLDRVRKQLDRGDMRDRGKMLEKLQESVDPADFGRFMEIFSGFITTPEGREMAAELERMVERLEGVVNSDRGRRLGDSLDRMGQGQLRERMEQLMRGRDATPERRGGPRADEPRRPERSERPRNVPEGARLY